MGPETLAHLLLHIGGSAKRRLDGPGLGITSATDPLPSPGGRRLIGTIEISLFSVSQLTYSFQIITKIEGDNYRTSATIALRQYADEDVAPGQDGDQKFESGQVNNWREKAADTDSHGTTIVLTSIRPQARDTLRSREIWSAIKRNEAQSDVEQRRAIEPPRYHIGRVDATENVLKKTAGKVWVLPWEKGDAPDSAFRKLVQSVWNEVEHS